MGGEQALYAMIVVGLGWQKAALLSHAREAVSRSLHRVGIKAPDYIAVPAFKRGDALPQEVACMWGAGVLWVDEADLQQMQPFCQTFSATVGSHVGVASVAEACALAGAGDGAHLRLPRQVFCGVTCAVAEGEKK